jgi:hypothetical protein
MYAFESRTKQLLVLVDQLSFKAILSFYKGIEYQLVFAKVRPELSCFCFIGNKDFLNASLLKEQWNEHDDFIEVFS